VTSIARHVRFAPQKQTSKVFVRTRPRSRQRIGLLACFGSHLKPTYVSSAPAVGDFKLLGVKAAAAARLHRAACVIQSTVHVGHAMIRSRRLDQAPALLSQLFSETDGPEIVGPQAKPQFVPIRSGRVQVHAAHCVLPTQSAVHARCEKPQWKRGGTRTSGEGTVCCSCARI
jgi:hypothetical protein